MKLYPATYQTTDGIYDRSHRIWVELNLVLLGFPLGFFVGLFTA